MTLIVFYYLFFLISPSFLAFSIRFFFSFFLGFFVCGRWFGVVALQAGHGDSSYGHDGLPVSGAESYLESYNSLTINMGPLLLLGGTILR